MYKVEFYPPFIAGKWALYIEKPHPDPRANDKRWEYRKQIAGLLGVDTTKLKEILTKQYKAIVYGRGYQQMYTFETREDCQVVKEYIETLLVGRQLIDE